MNAAQIRKIMQEDAKVNKGKGTAIGEADWEVPTIPHTNYIHGIAHLKTMWLYRKMGGNTPDGNTRSTFERLRKQGCCEIINGSYFCTEKGRLLLIELGMIAENGLPMAKRYT